MKRANEAEIVAGFVATLTVVMRPRTSWASTHGNVLTAIDAWYVGPLLLDRHPETCIECAWDDLVKQRSMLPNS